MSRPSSIHLCSESVSAIVIRSIPMTRFFRPVAVFLDHQPVRHLKSPTHRISLTPTHRVQEKCTAWAKAKRASKVAELVDLYWDGEPKGRSSDQAAGVPVPARW